MSALQIDTRLVEKLEQLAAERSIPVEQFVEEAVSTYLRQTEQHEIAQNILAYEEKLAELRRLYADQFVAIHSSEMVDHDRDFQALHQRIRQQYGSRPVLIRKVGESERQWTFRSPRFETT